MIEEMTFGSSGGIEDVDLFGAKKKPSSIWPDIDVGADVAPHDITVPLELGRALAGGAIGFGADVVGTTALAAYGGAKGLAARLIAPEIITPEESTAETAKRIELFRRAVRFATQPEEISPAAQALMDPVMKGIEFIEKFPTYIEPVTEVDPEAITTPLQGLPGPEDLKDYLVEQGYPNAAEVSRLWYILGLFKLGHLPFSAAKTAVKGIRGADVATLKEAAPESLDSLVGLLGKEKVDALAGEEFEVGRVEARAREAGEAKAGVERLKETRRKLEEQVKGLEKEVEPKPKPKIEEVTLFQRPAIKAVEPKPLEVGDAKAIREYERQVPRERDVVEGRKDEGREDIQRVEEEERAEVEEEALRGRRIAKPFTKLEKSTLRELGYSEDMIKATDGKAGAGLADTMRDVLAEYGRQKLIDSGKITELRPEPEVSPEISKIVEEDLRRFEEGPKLEVIKGGKEDLPTFESGSKATGEGWVLNVRSFKSKENAEKFRTVLEKRQGPELEAEEGVSQISVIKVGKATYRVGIKETPDLDLAIEDVVRKQFGEEDLPYGNLITEGELKGVEPTTDVSPSLARERLKELAGQVFDMTEEGPKIKEGIDIDRTIGDIARAASGFNSRDPRFSDIVDIGDKFISILQQSKDPSVPGLNVEPHPVDYLLTSGAEIVLGKEGAAFKNVADALSYLKDEGTGGRVVPDPREVDSPNWIIERGGLIDESIKSILDRAEKVKGQVGERKPTDLNEFASVGLMRFLNILLKEEGEIKIEKLKPEQAEALRKILQRALQAGMSTFDYLRENGYDVSTARSVDRATKRLGDSFETRNRKVTDPIVTDIEKYETGIDMNAGVTGVKRGYDIRKTPLWEGEARGVIAGKDLSESRFARVPFMNWTTGLSDWFTTMTHVFDEAGPYYKTLHRDYHKRNTAKNREIKAEEKWLLDLRKGVSREGFDRMFRFTTGDQKGGEARLKTMGEDSITWEELKPREQNAVTKMREGFDKLHDRASQTRTSIGEDPVGYVENYAPFMEALNWARDAGMEPNTVMSKSEYLNERFVQYNTTSVRAFKARSKEGKIARLETNPFTTYNKYMRSVYNDIYMSPLVSKVKALRETFRNPDTGNPYKLANRKPRLDEALRTWSNFIAGKRPEYLRFPRYVDSKFRGISTNMTFAYLAASARTALIQLSALRNSWVIIDGGHLAKGIAKAITPGVKERAFELSNVLEGRVYDATVADLAASIQLRARGVKSVVGRIAMAPMQFMDLRTALATWEGAYSMAVKKLDMKAGKGGEAARFADETVLRTQASALPGDIAPIQRTAFGKFITMFQTFVINDWNFLTRDVLGIRNAKISNTKILHRVVKYVAGTLLINALFEDVIGIRSSFGTPGKALMRGIEDNDNVMNVARDVFMEGLEIVPVLSSARYGEQLGGAGVELIGRTVKSIKEIDFKDSWADIAERNWQTVTTWLGVPGTAQVGRIVRGETVKEKVLGKDPDKYRRRKKKTRRPKGLGGGLGGL